MDIHSSYYYIIICLHFFVVGFTLNMICQLVICNFVIPIYIMHSHCNFSVVLNFSHSKL